LKGGGGKEEELPEFWEEVGAERVELAAGLWDYEVGVSSFLRLPSRTLIKWAKYVVIFCDVRADGSLPPLANLHPPLHRPIHLRRRPCPPSPPPSSPRPHPRLLLIPPLFVLKGLLLASDSESTLALDPRWHQTAGRESGKGGREAEKAGGELAEGDKEDEWEEVEREKVSWWTI
jgi:hypothetical protein